MDNAFYYLAINRQRGLASEMAMIANNIANHDTPGFRRQGIVFSEVVHAAETGESVSMADTGAAFADRRPGEMRITGGALDVALEGRGYFTIEGEDGPLLTRAGAFQRNADGLMVTMAGREVLDDGGAPIFLPADVGPVEIAGDGTLSAGGVPIARLGVADAPPDSLTRVGDTAYESDAPLTPVEGAAVRQGALERSNVDPVLEIARMISVSRAYEQARSLIEDEDERIQNVIRTLGQAA